MRSLKTEPVIYDRVRKIITGVFAGTLIIAVLYLFILLTSSTDVMTLKTFLTIFITILIFTVIPYSSARILDNAKKKDRNNALKNIAEKVNEKYSVKFKNTPCVNTAAVFGQENGEYFYGVITMSDDQEPVLKVLADYTDHKAN